MTPSFTPKQYVSSLVSGRKKHSNSHQTFPLNLPGSNIRPTFNGSAALYQAAKQLNIRKGDAVLLPAYGCGAEIGPFTYLECKLYFYDIDDALNANTQHIEQLLEQHPDIKLVLVTHYLGFAQANIKNIQTLCDKFSTPLLEDCAHALYGTHEQDPLGSFGQCAIFSPRKTIGLTDGGLFISNTKSEQLTTAESAPETTAKKPDLVPYLQRLFYSMRQYYRSADPSQHKRIYTTVNLALLSMPAALIKLGKKAGLFNSANWATADIEGVEAVPIYETGMSSSMYRLLTQTDAANVKTHRQHNYRLWLDAMNTGDIKTKAKPVFPTLPADCCPLYFPLRVENPAKLVHALTAYGIESFNWWHHLHPSISWQHYPVAKKMKGQIVALPLHHQMSSAQVRYAANCVQQILLTSEDL